MVSPGWPCGRRSGRRARDETCSRGKSLLDGLAGVTPSTSNRPPPPRPAVDPPTAPFQSSSKAIKMKSEVDELVGSFGVAMGLRSEKSVGGECQRQPEHRVYSVNAWVKKIRSSVTSD
ncbi:hypothetical protein L198_00885 [Cryptococcus wingfieldii CBS 7118]|uniref:Uncharacterized protein n=1 Tax=Cryptococcus wingfieldii CBS 7118 TaxID=1295528 RepID=A0A1E3K2R8_9TREE|nr:hypothetical protein L198_00885 [Cryptococcus wingfieldii CBS 7118]ODO07306.1 hypothetical protein L198_00885 [Cryptococcus wingfieldii CBS 7118]